MRIAVIGIGQDLRGDDAAGLEIVRRWQREYAETASLPEIQVQATDTSGLALLDLFDGMDAAVLVDAVRSQAEPGTLHRLDPDQLSSATLDSQSSHGWGVAEALQLSCTLEPSLKERRLRLVGIEAGQTLMGSDLSPSVQACLPLAARAVQEEVLTLMSGRSV